MASELEFPYVFERVVRNTDMFLFLPFIFGSSNVDEDPDQQSESTESAQHETNESVIFINSFTQGMMVIDGSSSMETLFRVLGCIGKEGISKECIDAMPSVEVGEGEDGVCVICLEEWEVGGVAKVMPCYHKFHPSCIEKWLGVNGSCPVCRYEMPFDVSKKGDEEGGERRRRRIGREVGASFYYTNQAPSGDYSDYSSSPTVGDAEGES